MDVIILTGMSGAGKSQAAGYLEDQGYFCIDNVPPQVLPDLIALFNRGEGDMAGIDKVAFVVDIRSRELIKGFGQAMKRIDEETPVPYRIVFLEASDNVLVNRYRQTRRKHPLTDEMSLTEAIATERRMLNRLRGRATYIIDTTMTTAAGLKKELRRILEDTGATGLSVFIQSFGFMYGIPSDSDNTMDVRFLPNPFWVEDLKMLCGKDKEIEEYLSGFEETKEFMEKAGSLYEFMLPLYLREGKSRLDICVGCTGGRHRSVYIAEQLGKVLSDKGYRVTVHHRDIDRDPRYKADGKEPRQ
ncbi:MAG: RNase adapter RapZ [Clostridiales bacterium]|nr:RNase adapter RapZ [Clostridiales bacterium]